MDGEECSWRFVDRVLGEGVTCAVCVEVDRAWSRDACNANANSGSSPSSSWLESGVEESSPKTAKGTGMRSPSASSTSRSNNGFGFGECLWCR